MEFNPNNSVVQLCIQGMHQEEKANFEEAAKLFNQAWNEATGDFEKFLAAWFVARRQSETTGRLAWYKTALQLALTLDKDAVAAALPSLYNYIAQCYQDLDDIASATTNRELALKSASQPLDMGSFYHGTKADLKAGDLLTAGRLSNYKAELIMNHIYFTALVNGAGLAAALAKGDGPERVYIVVATGDFEDDPNVTNKKFPGNPTRSYRTRQPLKVIGEVSEWLRPTPEQLQQWRAKLAANKGDIIN